jgi:capsular polysaccharide biosynthesis protein
MMPNKIDSKGVTVSVKIYERLLAICPADFRREYGPAMKQLFRDQCRDAWSEAQGRGLAVLWLRVLPDLAKTSLVEHLTSLHRKESLFMKTVRAIRADPRLRATFIRVFALVFILALVWSDCETYWTRKVYLSTVRFEVQKDTPDLPATRSGRPPDLFTSDPYFLTTQFKIIKSYSILTNVIATLHLDEKLAAQTGDTPWTMDQTYLNLFDKISVQRTRMTSLTEISVKNPDPKLAADIANAIVGAYRESRLEKWKGERDLSIAEGHSTRRSIPMEEIPVVTIRDPARPTMRPIESRLEIFSRWMFGGTLAALVAGGVGAWLGHLIRRFSHRQGTPP